MLQPEIKLVASFVLFATGLALVYVTTKFGHSPSLIVLGGLVSLTGLLLLAPRLIRLVLERVSEQINYSKNAAGAKLSNFALIVTLVFIASFVLLKDYRTESFIIVITIYVALILFSMVKRINQKK